MLGNYVIGFSNQMNKFYQNQSVDVNIIEQLEKRNIFSKELVNLDLFEHLPIFWKEFTSESINDSIKHKIEKEDIFKVESLRGRQLFYGCIHNIEEYSKKQIRIAEGNLTYIEHFFKTKEPFISRLKNVSRMNMWMPYFYNLDYNILWDIYTMLDNLERNLDNKQYHFYIHIMWQYEQELGKF